MKQTIFFLCLLWLTSFNLLAQPTILNLAEKQCTLVEVVKKLHSESVERRALIAEQTIPVIENIKALTDKVKINNKPIREQLSALDLDKFSRYSQQIQTMQLAALIESRKIRDLQAIERMAILADQDYRWNKVPKEGTDDYIFYAAYLSIRQLSSKLDLTEPKSNQCTLEFALHKQAIEPLAKLEPILPRLQEALNYNKSLSSKYKMDPIDRRKLLESERFKLDEYENTVISVFKKNYSYALDIQAIKVMAIAFELMHSANLQDISIGGGSIDAVGKTIQRNFENKKYDEPTQLAIGVWTKINEKIPSQDVQEWMKFKSYQ